MAKKATKAKEVKIDEKVEVIEQPKKQKKPNRWLIHVKAFREKNPEMTYKEVLQKARETYKKGGNVEVKPSENLLEIKKEPADETPTEKVVKKKVVKKKVVKKIG